MMRRPPRSLLPSTRSRALVAAGLTTLAGCQTWRPVPAATRPEQAAAAGADPLRVVLRDGRIVDVYEPEVRGDSIVGRARPWRGRGDEPAIGVARAAVQRYEVQELSTGRTVRAAVLWGAGLAGIAMLAYVVALGRAYR